MCCSVSNAICLVSADELADARLAFQHGKYPLRLEETEFSFADYEKALMRDRASIAAFKQHQQAAFDAERQRWKQLRIDDDQDSVVGSAPSTVDDVPDGHVGAYSEVPGNVWKIFVSEGDDVVAGGSLAIIESMKMEIILHAPTGGRISFVLVKPGQTLRAGELVALIEELRT